jgi:hypothetical protein
MLRNWIQVPANVVYLARRTAGLSVMVAGSLGAAVVPSLLMPRDRIAWNAWAAGYLADLASPVTGDSLGRDNATAG